MPIPIICECGSLHIRKNGDIYICIKCKKRYSMSRDVDCHYCGEPVYILDGPSTYKYDKRVKKVVHMRCYIGNRRS